MATRSFDSYIKVDKNSAESMSAILNSEKKIVIEKEKVAKDIDVKSLRKFLGK